MIRSFLFWLIREVDLGRLAPWILGLALGSWPREVNDVLDK